MAEILRVKTTWSGFVGGPGYTNLYFRDFTEGPTDQGMADGAVAKVAAFNTVLKDYLCSGVTLTIDPMVDRLEETTGELVGFFTTAPGVAKVGGDTGNQAAGVGACISWTTGGVRNGRRIRGRTFLVPIATNYYATDGSLSTTFLTALRAAAITLSGSVGSGDLGVWSRPSGPGASDGVWYVVTASSIRDKVAVLTSRRD